uniref:F-box domain-containing protein n=1 Tax=Bracon brevicornis TaxID=1563983 RepID=A0A6V7M080_9HYME
MEFFRMLMSCFGVSQPEYDPTKNLPVEVTQHIFRMLDAPSLLNAARVSREWLYVCRGDPRLRATARRHLRREKRRAYGLPSAGKPKVVVRSEEVKKIPQKQITQKSVSAKAPVAFTFGPTGVSRGLKAQNVKHVSGSRSQVETKRSMIRFR